MALNDYDLLALRGEDTSVVTKSSTAPAVLRGEWQLVGVIGLVVDRSGWVVDDGGSIWFEYLDDAAFVRTVPLKRLDEVQVIGEWKECR